MTFWEFQAGLQPEIFFGGPQKKLPFIPESACTPLSDTFCLHNTIGQDPRIGHGGVLWADRSLK